MDNNFHFHKAEKPITEDQQCRAIRTGPSVTRVISDFRKRSLQYFQDNYVEGERHFPPSFYLKVPTVQQWTTKLDSLKTFRNGDVKFLTPYNPKNHLYIIGLNDKDCDDIISTGKESFDDVILIVDFLRHLLIISIINTGQDRESLYKGVQKLDDVTKTILHVASGDVKQNYLTILSVPVYPNIDLQTLELNLIFSQDFLKNGMSLTKDDLISTEKLEDKFDMFFQKATKVMRQCFKREDVCQKNEGFLQNLCGEIMSAMAFTTQYLPKISEYVPEKIDTILLNHNQINLINDPCKWKIIKGPFGSGRFF